MSPSMRKLYPLSHTVVTDQIRVHISECVDCDVDYARFGADCGLKTHYMHCEIAT